MKKTYFQILTFLFIICALTGCKLDPPIYPANGGTTTGGNDGTPTGLLNNGSSITYNINGFTTTLGYVSIEVLQPTPATVPMGNTQILGGTSVNEEFSISFGNIKPGTYNIDILYLSGLFGTNGKVKLTEINTLDDFHGTMKGSFTTDLMDSSGNIVDSGVTGTFNINIPK